MLGLAGGALGVQFAQAGIGLLRWIAPVALPRAQDIDIDTVVLFVTLATVVVTSLLFGLVPVLKYSMLNGEVLKDAGRLTTHGSCRHRCSACRQRTRSTYVAALAGLAVVAILATYLPARSRFEHRPHCWLAVEDVSGKGSTTARAKKPRRSSFLARFAYVLESDERPSRFRFSWRCVKWSSGPPLVRFGRLGTRGSMRRERRPAPGRRPLRRA